MSRVPSRSARERVRSIASAPAAAGFRPAAAALAVAAAFAVPPVQAQPAGGTALSGSFTTQAQGNTFIVNTVNGAGNRSVINWQGFSVPGGTVTDFRQPTASSTSINRVTGGARSDIFGTLKSNGNLVLVNPTGIAFGPNAMVDTASFTASTLALSESDAVAGRLRLQGGSNAIQVGDGARILAHAGDVVLVGSQVQVERNAVVQASGATILAAGEKVEITGRGLEGIALQVQAGNQAVNLGTLQGDAVGIFAGTLKHSGLVQAQAVTTDGGKVVLKSMGGDTLVDGTVVASAANGKGGSVDVLGNRVGLLAGSLIDASGAHGGGSVRIGGDYQGSNAAVPNAQAVYFDAAASVKADATSQGDGGRVIVWSDQVTRMRGAISARGAGTGQGGFAEVSSKGQLAFTGYVDLRSAFGAAGTLLLDPQDILIFHTGDSRYTQDYIALANNTGGADFTYTGGSSYIPDDRINAQLATSNLTITTSHDATRYPPPPSPPPISDSGTGGQITMNSDAVISWTNANKLEMLADKGIAINGTISGTSDGTSFGTDSGSSVSMLAKAGSIVLAPGASVIAGSVKLDARGAGSNIQIDSAPVTATSGDITLAAKQDILVGTLDGATATAYTNIYTPGRLSLTAGGNVKTSMPQGSTYTYGSQVTLQGGSGATGGVSVISQGGDVDFGSSTYIYASQSTVSVNAKNSVLGAASISTYGSTDPTGAAAAVTMTAGGGISFGSITATAGEGGGMHGGNVSLNAGGDVSGGSISTNGLSNSAADGGNAGNVTVTAGGGITLSSISAAAGSSYPISSTPAPVPATSGGRAATVNLTGGTGITVESIDVTGGDGTTPSSGGNVTLTTSSGNVSVYSVAANGGANTSADGGSTATGAAGGNVSITAPGTITIGYIDAIGGNSDTGTGGQGGQVQLSTGGGLVGNIYSECTSCGPASYFYISAYGGGGGKDPLTGNGLTGGQGGSLQVSYTSGDLVADSGWYVDTSGGTGGAADTGIPAAVGGVGGAGGAIQFIAPGRVQLASPVLYAIGGGGGLAADDSTNAASGANGTFRAQATGVDVVGSLTLGADWINDTVVKIADTSSADVVGTFQNSGQVQLYDSGSLYAINGVVNGGLLTAYGPGVSANITQNASTGIVNVVAGATLYAPNFLSNDGTVNVDGTLRVAEPVSPTLAAAAFSPTVFLNQASGVLSGTGTVVVNGGLGTVDNYGTISPGGNGGIGALTVSGNLLMESGSTLAADLLNSASVDNVVVSGSLSTGGTVAVNYLAGTTFSSGDTFHVMQSGGLDPAAPVPAVNKPQLRAQTSGNDLVLVANAGYPPAPPAPPPPPAPGADATGAQQVTNNQVVTFAELFVQMSEQQQQEADDRRIGKDDIVVTDTACTR